MNSIILDGDDTDSSWDEESDEKNSRWRSGDDTDSSWYEDTDDNVKFTRIIKEFEDGVRSSVKPCIREILDGNISRRN